jgi:4-hydroxybenzoate polyprenyltransferase
MISNLTPIPTTGMGRLKLFLALSRTPHGLLDLATPVVAAILWLGKLPPGPIIPLGLTAAFAGYTAVYALNDLVDYQSDREKLQRSDPKRQAGYLDAALVRHPLAQGFLSLPEAVAWTTFWALLSLACAWQLNPVCALILVAGCVLEGAYCLLLRVSQLRALISGMVKTLGGLAAVFAVDQQPEPGLLLLLFLWLFFWEIGGQNVPADWHDLEEDTALGARTIPVYYGVNGASTIALVSLAVSVAIGGIFLAQAPLKPTWLLLPTALLAAFGLLLLPGWRLYRLRRREEASALFNRASYYPLSLLVLVGLVLLLRG